jgi:hypothetical protein
MNRRELIKSGSLIAAAAPLIDIPSLAWAKPARSTVWDRPLHFVYGPLRRKYTDAQFMKMFDQVKPGITAISPFSLNTVDFTPLAPFIKLLKERNIVITPGVGAKPKDGPINSERYKAMAKAAREYTDHIRLENMQGFIDTWGQAPIQDMIDYCAGTLGFKHIMLNPWPKLNGKVVPFKNPELQSSFNQVNIKFDRKTYDVTDMPRNYTTNLDYVREILAYRPSCAILVNYESAPQHELLTHMEQQQKGSSTRVLEITAKQCQDFKDNLYWAPPFTHVYDPYELGTWDWIAKRLSQMP